MPTRIQTEQSRDCGGNRRLIMVWLMLKRIDQHVITDRRISRGSRRGGRPTFFDSTLQNESELIEYSFRERRWNISRRWHGGGRADRLECGAAASPASREDSESAFLDVLFYNATSFLSLSLSLSLSVGWSVARSFGRSVGLPCGIRFVCFHPSFPSLTIEERRRLLVRSFVHSFIFFVFAFCFLCLEIIFFFSFDANKKKRTEQE